MASGKLGYFEYQLNIAYQKLKIRIQGKHPHTNILHPQWIMDRLLLKFARQQLQNLPDKSLILDVGCGNGPYWEINPLLNWEGIDIYETEKTKYLIQSDGNYPIEDSRYDYIICTQVMEHVDDFEKSAIEIMRVLKPGGTLILNTPFLYPFHGMPNDYFRFTTSGLRLIFSDLEIEKVGTIGGFGSSLGTLMNNYWNYITALNWKLRIIGLVSWPISLFINLFWNILSLVLDKCDKTASFPLNVYLIGKKPKGAAEIEISPII